MQKWHNRKGPDNSCRGNCEFYISPFLSTKSFEEVNFKFVTEIISKTFQCLSIWIQWLQEPPWEIIFLWVLYAAFNIFLSMAIQAMLFIWLTQRRQQRWQISVDWEVEIDFHNKTCFPRFSLCPHVNDINVWIYLLQSHRLNYSFLIFL